MNICHREPPAYLSVDSCARVVVPGQQAEARLLVKLPKKLGSETLVGGFPRQAELILTSTCSARDRLGKAGEVGGGKNEAFRLQSHTYMNDERIGVLIVGADEKVHQELSPVFLVELGDDVLQPPRLALKDERQTHWSGRRNSWSSKRAAVQQDTLPNVASQLSTAMGHSDTSASTANSGCPPLSSIKPSREKGGLF